MHTIQLTNTEFEGANAVYLLGDDKTGRTTLVDTGTADPAVREMLEAELAAVGVALDDIDQVLLTHFHGDHAGGAGAIQNASGAVVRVHEDDAALVERDPTATRDLQDLKLERFERWGVPADVRTRLESNFGNDRLWSETAADVVPFADGDRFDVGETELEAVHLPGHTAGHSGFVLETESEDVLFSGDALLPEYTPNVGGADVRVDGPLESYLGSLVRIVERHFEVAYPGHRAVIEDPSGRARHILEHHLERTVRVVGVLSEHGPADAWTVSAHLFGELEGIHALHGPGEAFAHLEHLRAAGVVILEDDRYELRDQSPDLESLFPDLE